MKARARLAATMACAACVASSANAGRPAEILRTEKIAPASFEYVFTSVVTPSAENPTLSFNHRSGRTRFARVGDRFGDFTVVAFDRDLVAGKATLKGADGREVVLELGKPLPQGGLTARLISLETGRSWEVAEKDSMSVSGSAVTVVRISDQAVTASAEGQEFTVPAITDADRARLVQLREERKQREAALMAQQSAVVRPDFSDAPAAPTPPRLPPMQVDFQYNGPPEFYYMPGIPYPPDPTRGRNQPVRWLLPPNAIIHHMVFPSVRMNYTIPSGAFSARGGSLIQSREDGR